MDAKRDIYNLWVQFTTKVSGIEGKLVENSDFPSALINRHTSHLCGLAFRILSLGSHAGISAPAIDKRTVIPFYRVNHRLECDYVH